MGRLNRFKSVLLYSMVMLCAILLYLSFNRVNLGDVFAPGYYGIDEWHLISACPKTAV